MTNTAQGPLQITEYFESADQYISTLNPQTLFNYDNNLNIGYGVNLTQAATNAARGNATLEQDINSVLDSMLGGFTISVSYWSQILTNSGQNLANKLNSLPRCWAWAVTIAPADRWMFLGLAERRFSVPA